MLDRYLPIGTVVLLKDATKRIMITGYYMRGSDNEKVNDYVGVIFPEGLVTSEMNLLFDNDQIDKIYHLGLIDEEERDYVSGLTQTIEMIESGEIKLNESANEAAPQNPMQNINLGVPNVPEAAPAMTPPVINQAPMTVPGQLISQMAPGMMPPGQMGPAPMGPGPMQPGMMTPPGM